MVLEFCMMHPSWFFSSFRWRPSAIRDFFSKRLKIQVAACYLWHRPPQAADAHTLLLSAACNLFQQVDLIFFDLEILCFIYESESLNWLPFIRVLADYLCSWKIFWCGPICWDKVPSKFFSEGQNSGMLFEKLLTCVTLQKIPLIPCSWMLCCLSFTLNFTLVIIK